MYEHFYLRFESFINSAPVQKGQKRRFLFRFLVATANFHILVPRSAMCAFAAIIALIMVTSSFLLRAVSDAARRQRVTAHREGGAGSERRKLSWKTGDRRESAM